MRMQNFVACTKLFARVFNKSGIMPVPQTPFLKLFITQATNSERYYGTGYYPAGSARIIPNEALDRDASDCHTFKIITIKEVYNPCYLLKKK